MRWRFTLSLACCLACASVALPSCTRAPTHGAGELRASAPPPSAYEIAEVIFDAGPKNGWSDVGFAPRAVEAGKPAAVDLSNGGSWVLAERKLDERRFGGVTFRVKAPVGEAEFLELRLDSTQSTIFPRVKVTADQRRDLGDGWVEVVVPMSALNPNRAPFDRIVFRAFRPIPPERILIDKIALTVAPAAPSGSAMTAVIHPFQGTT